MRSASDLALSIGMASGWGAQPAPTCELQAQDCDED